MEGHRNKTKEHRTDYDHEIPAVSVDTDPRIGELKGKIVKTIRRLCEDQLATKDEIADVIGTAESLKDLDAKTKDLIHNHIAGIILDICETENTLDEASKDVAYEDFRMDFLLSHVPRVPGFPGRNLNDNLQSRQISIRSQLFKNL